MTRAATAILSEAKLACALFMVIALYVVALDRDATDFVQQMIGRM